MSESVIGLTQEVDEPNEHLVLVDAGFHGQLKVRNPAGMSVIWVRNCPASSRSDALMGW
jgi:hypothetical protein